MNLFINIAKIVTILICFGFLYYNLDFILINKILLNIRFDNLLPLIISFILYLFFYSLFVFKIYDYLFKSKLTFKSWLKIFINGNFLNSIPFFGFIYKGYRLKNYNISVKNYLFANIFISWFAIAIFFFIYSMEIAFLVNTKISIFDIPVYIILLSLSILAFFGPFIGNFFFKKIKYQY